VGKKKKGKFKSNSVESFSVDLVVPFVDPSDTQWQKDREEWAEKCKDPSLNEVSLAANQDFRFRDWGIFPYVFRSIQENIPWIRKIFLIVASDTQVPAWLNRDTVEIVKHSDIFDADELPVFSPTIIEMKLGNIKGLSEHFIYVNDDMFFLKPLKKSDFFTEGGGLPKIGFETFSVFDVEHINPFIYNYGFRQKYLFSDEFDLKGDRTTYGIYHGPQPVLKSVVNYIQRKYAKEIKENSFRFRKAVDDYNIYIYHIYSILSKKYEKGQSITQYSSIESLADVPKTVEGDMLCINDYIQSEEEAGPIIQLCQSRLESLFPNKSKYEL